MHKNFSCKQISLTWWNEYKLILWLEIQTKCKTENRFLCWKFHKPFTFNHKGGTKHWTKKINSAMKFKHCNAIIGTQSSTTCHSQGVWALQCTLLSFQSPRGTWRRWSRWTRGSSPNQISLPTELSSLRSSWLSWEKIVQNDFSKDRLQLPLSVELVPEVGLVKVATRSSTSLSRLLCTPSLQ